MADHSDIPSNEELLAAAARSHELMDDPLVIDLPAMKEHLKTLDDLNSRFPATADFLRARGLTHMSQLDAAGNSALKQHLLAMLDTLTRNAK